MNTKNKVNIIDSQHPILRNLDISDGIIIINNLKLRENSIKIAEIFNVPYISIGNIGSSRIVGINAYPEIDIIDIITNSILWSVRIL